MSSQSGVAIVVLGCVLCAAAAAEELPLRDPTRPYDRAAAPPAVPGAPRYVLTGVLVSDRRRVAVINGGLFAEGDRVDGARVERIEPHRVHLSRDGNEWIVALRPSGRSGGETEGAASR